MKLTAINDAPLPTALYTAEQVGELDRLAIESGIPGIALMKRAGRAAFDLLLERFPAPESICVYCGGGNNAGDGYVVAALAAQRRITVRIIEVGKPEKLRGEAAQAREFAQQEAVPMTAFSDAEAPTEGVLVDAMLGTGLHGEVRGPFVDAIAQINNSGLPVLAIDVPSGLDSDTGAILGTAVKAGVTITFIGLKRGLLTGSAPRLVGELVFADLDVPADIYSKVTAEQELLERVQLMNALPRRERDAHKGAFGHVMVIGGDTGFGGAAIIAAEAAARTGAGLVSLATRPEHMPAALVRCPEVMVCGVTSGQELEPWLDRPSVLIVGPGLGRSSWGEQMLQQAVNSGLPMVLDADALNLIAEGRVVSSVRRDNWLLTPHPGEAARLLNCSVKEIQDNRFAAVARLQQVFGGAIVLKGAGSLVAAPEQLVGVVNAGNPGMASGGMGDLLSGILGGLLAQGLTPTEAARLGACLHAEAADLAVEDWGERSLLASDLIPELCQLLAD